MQSVGKRRGRAQNFRGITLIALVITIIIMLILAGIAINLGLGENGLLNKARKARENMELAEIEEQSQINDLYSKIMIATNDSSEITMSIEDLNTLINTKVQEQNTFSTEEKVIGKWIDGKPLYRKTIEITTTGTELQTYNHNIENVDKIFIDTGNTFFEREKDNTFFPYFLTGVNSIGISTSNVLIIQSVNREKIQIRQVNMENVKALITLKYTKTTD